MELNWEKIRAWCLEYKKDVPCLSEPDAAKTHPPCGDTMSQWQQELEDMLKGPLFDSFLNAMGLTKVAIFGVSTLSGLLCRKISQQGTKVLCFIDKNPAATCFETKKVVRPWDVDTYREAEIIFFTEYPSKENTRFMQRFQKRLHKNGSGQAVFISGIMGMLYPLFKFGSQLSTIKENRNIEIHLFNRYSLRDFKNHTDEEKMLLNSPAEICPYAKTIRTDSGIRHADCRGESLNIINGVRYTSDVPAIYQRKVHLFGDCNIFGYGTDDSHTIASRLQRKLNRIAKDSCRVINHGIQGLNVLCSLSFETIQNTSLKDGDILLFLYDSSLYMREYQKFFHAFYEYLDIGFHDLYEPFAEKRLSSPQKLLYLDQVHLSSDGMKVAADSFALAILKGKMMGIKQTGAIVMAANPFTKGHRYLIEEALKKSDSLYIFVVQEEGFAFTFEERFQLVKEGTKDLENIHVRPSGKYILSNITFPGYFLKESKEEITVDPATDIELFGTYIAPQFHISTRFVADEPLCGVTRQYNEGMKEAFPLYHIALEEIKRKEINGVPISASLVRKLIKEDKWEEIKELVPPSTYAYLLQKNLSRT